MFGNKLLLVAVGVMSASTSAYGVIVDPGSESSLPSGRPPRAPLAARLPKASPPAPTLPSVGTHPKGLSTEHLMKQAPELGNSSHASGKLPGSNEDMSLTMEQIKMLKEVNRIANECHRQASEIAANGAVEPEKFRDEIKRKGEQQIFPEYANSIFERNPKFVSNAVHPEKMDRQTFVAMLKEQKGTTKTMVADILTKVLDWKDIGKVEKYKVDISGDLRALSSFCSAPLIMLNKAIEYKRSTLGQPQKKGKTGFINRFTDKLKK